MPTETVQPKTYFASFVALMALLALTVGANFLNLGPFNVVVAMLIAAAKAGLIILFFMEVRYSHPIVWVFATAGFLWLLLMFVMMMSDYSTRSWIGPDWRNATDGKNHVEFAQPR